MSTLVAGALAVTPLYATAADAVVAWDALGATWRSLGTIPVGGGTVTSIAAGTGITVSPSPIVGAGTVSLTVPVAVANGGTGTGTAFTAGSVVFAGPSGVYAQDNANLFWDDSNNRLLIGTSTGATTLAKLQVQAATDENLIVTGHFTYSSGVALHAVTNNSSANVPMEFRASSFDFTGGNVGIGTASPAVALDVAGTVNATGLACTNIYTANIRDAGGVVGLTVGPTNFHYADSHNFINRAGSSYFAAFDAALGTRNQSGAWATFSARELKQEIAPYERGLADLVQLQPRVFRYRAGTPFARSADEPGDLQLGLIADEVEPYLPELVSETVAMVGKEEVAVASLTPGNAIYAVINSIKELASRVEQLEARL